MSRRRKPMILNSEEARESILRERLEERDNYSINDLENEMLLLGVNPNGKYSEWDIKRLKRYKKCN